MNWRVLTDSVEYALKKNLQCDLSLTSNGMWSKSQRNFILSHFSNLSISIDGIQPVQDSQRPRPDGTGSFTSVMETVKALGKAAIPFGIRATVTLDTIDFLPDSTAFFCKETKAHGIQVDPSYTSSRGVYDDMPEDLAEKFVNKFIEAFEIACDAKRTFYYSGARPWLISSSFCQAPEEALIVNPDEDLVTCYEIYDRRHPYADQFIIGKASSSNISVDHKALHRFIKSQEARRAKCRNCFCYWHCAGDCASRAMASPTEKSVRCQVNQNITRELLAYYISQGNGVWRGNNTFVNNSNA